MSKYLMKPVIEESTENVANAHIALELVTNMITRKAHVKEGGWKSAQGIVDGKDQATQPVLWTEPNIDDLVTLKVYPIATPIEDILFDVIGYRMVTLAKIPGTDIDNPYLGGSFEDLPAPSEG